MNSEPERQPAPGEIAGLELDRLEAAAAQRLGKAERPRFSMMPVVSPAEIGRDAYVVLGVLANHADNRTGKCWLKVGTIAKEAGYASHRAVRSALSKLEASGHISREHRPGRSTVFRVVYTPAVESRPPGCTEPPGPAAESRRNYTALTTPTRPTPLAPREKDVEAEFDRVRAEYPRLRWGRRDYGLAAWRDASRPPTEDLVVAARCYARKLSEPRYAKNFVAWLRGSMWESEMVEVEAEVAAERAAKVSACLAWIGRHKTVAVDGQWFDAVEAGRRFGIEAPAERERAVWTKTEPPSACPGCSADGLARAYSDEEHECVPRPRREEPG